MEDFPSQRLQGLSAHIEGLVAALEALPTDPDTGASMRRIARSLSAAADKAGAHALAEAARRIHETDDDGLERGVRAFLREVASLRDAGDPQGAHVLLVEDNRTVAAAVIGYLNNAGHTVHHAASAEEAERCLSRRVFDIVLLDLILPDRDGRDLLVQMRESPATAEIPVVVLTAKDGAVPRAECLAVGAAEFLEKPVEPAVLRAAVARHRRRGRDAGRQQGEDASEPAQAVLPGRAWLVEAYEPLRGAADSGARPAVALIAVNGFAAIREALGEDATERLLTDVAGPIGEALEAPGMIGRWRRGELVMVLPRSTASDAKRRVRAGVARLAASDALAAYAESGVDLSFSAGVAVADGGEDLRDVVSAAEESLHRARSAGHGTVVPRGEDEPESTPRVLLVEDDRVTATLIKHRLHRAGFEVIDFSDGQDAYRWAADATFDLAILDVKVPGMDGFELLERLRAITRFHAVPIVMLTGLGGEEDVIRGLDLGANDYMLKPFSPTELLARVRRLVFGGGSGASGAGGAPAAPAEVGAP